MINNNPKPGGLKLVVCSIRDEFFSRPTESAHEWFNSNKGYKLLGGMDMQEGVEGGTWLGMNMKTGDIAALLNIREPKPLANAERRGFLVVDYIKKIEPEEKLNYLNELKLKGDKYNGFNLITIDRDRKTGNYSLSSFSNLSNCLKLDQSNQSFIITNSMRIDDPWYRGTVFKKEFDLILSQYELINNLTNNLNASNLTSNNDSTNEDANEDKSKESLESTNSQNNVQTNVRINDSSDNFKDYSLKNVEKKIPPIEFYFSGWWDHEKDQANLTDKEKCNTNESKDESNHEKNLPIDFTEIENRKILVEKLLEIMLSKQNYYEEQKKDDYFKTQNSLASEFNKMALSSLCVSNKPQNYGSRIFTVILIDAKNQVNYYEWTRDKVEDTGVNHDLDKHYHFKLF